MPPPRFLPVVMRAASVAPAGNCGATLPPAGGKRGARGELRGNASANTRLKRERHRVFRRKRHYPVLCKLAHALEIATREHDAVVVDADEKSLVSVPCIQTSHDLLGIVDRGLLAAVVVLAPIRIAVATFAACIAKRTCVDCGERALPDCTLDRERCMRMARYRNCVAVLRQRLGQSAVVATPEMRAVASVLRRRMLEIEERLRGIYRLAILLEPFGRLGNADLPPAPAVVRNPMAADERIPLHFLAPYR